MVIDLDKYTSYTAHDVFAISIVSASLPRQTCFVLPKLDRISALSVAHGAQHGPEPNHFPKRLWQAGSWERCRMKQKN